ncbi:hypothetical protein EYF80_046719 [Liparis tanakae]|uniref:Uncharacterized protein n=1 Tax=Liparis tanakae TaxID=230148 RepID=A0A4Z2FQ86_9TELE|nr:hypothetical protein EYF80_046719 [Liparis tanakae]
MAKRTVSSYFLPKPHAREKTNPRNESDSDYEETVVAKKGFCDEWLPEFTWLRCFRETSSMNCTVCCRLPQHAGNTTCADKTGSTRLKHDTLIRHNAGLKQCAATCAMKVQLRALKCHALSRLVGLHAVLTGTNETIGPGRAKDEAPPPPSATDHRLDFGRRRVGLQPADQRHLSTRSTNTRFLWTATWFRMLAKLQGHIGQSEELTRYRR